MGAEGWMEVQRSWIIPSRTCKHMFSLHDRV